MYGSYVAIEGLGLVVGHGMSRFTYSADSPNRPAPGKRMQHNMSALVAVHEDDGKPAFAVGLPGGEKIVNATAQITVSMVHFGRTPAEAVKSPRLHTIGAEPLQITNDVPANVIREIENMGHTIERVASVGGPSNALWIDRKTGNVTGGCENGGKGVIEVA
jgi:gamma-glutamyltranspeptidase/glutathione hydrolase